MINGRNRIGYDMHDGGTTLDWSFDIGPMLLLTTCDAANQSEAAIGGVACCLSFPGSIYWYND